MPVLIFLLLFVLIYLLIGAFAILGGLAIHRLLPMVQLGFAVITSAILTVSALHFIFKAFAAITSNHQPSLPEQRPPEAQNGQIVNPFIIENWIQRQQGTSRKRRR